MCIRDRFGDVNEKVGTIAAEVGKTPQGWNANIFNMITNLSENVIVPIAGLVINYVLCYCLLYTSSRVVKTRMTEEEYAEFAQRLSCLLYTSRCV